MPCVATRTSAALALDALALREPASPARVAELRAAVASPGTADSAAAGAATGTAESAE